LGLWDMAFSFLLLAAPLTVLSIPGAFGRYIEHYRQRGQLRAFLRRTVLGCGGVAALALVGIVVARQWFSELVFGSTDESALVVLAAGCLTTVVAYNFLIELFTALRSVRLASGLQFINSVAFAVIGLALLAGWDCSAKSVLVSYGAACLLTVIWASRPLYRVWHAATPAASPLSHGALWAKMLPFAGWILLGNAMTNVFGVLDRYMIVHFSNIPADQVMDVIGNYHSSRVVPVLLVSIATMLGVMILPHLSHDWEAGRRAAVAARLQLFLKLGGFGMYAAAVAVMIAAPLLFEIAFRGKFPGGEAVLPLTLTYSTWFGMLFIAQNYLLCAEHAQLTSLALFAGLLLNIGLNLLWVPTMGLEGAVWASTAANGLALLLVCEFNQRLGFRLDGGAKLVLLLPLLLSLGPWIAATAIVVVSLDAAFTERMLSAEEKRRIAETLGGYKARIMHRRRALSPQ
jgi:polysaccharide transporter, PST family